MRTFLCAYFCKRWGHEFTLEPEKYGDPKIPRVIFTHDMFEHRTKGSSWDWLRGKYLVPANELRRARVILLARDPRDSFVSLYIQMTRRTAETPTSLREQPISVLLRDRRFGIGAIIKTMNHWMKMFADHPWFGLVKYEALRADPLENFRAFLVMLGHDAPDMSVLEEALEFSRFENMQQMEATGAFGSKILQPGDVRDPESFKVRRGKVGGFQEYLSPEDRQYATDAMENLDFRFGYT